MKFLKVATKSVVLMLLGVLVFNITFNTVSNSLAKKEDKSTSIKVEHSSDTIDLDKENSKSDIEEDETLHNSGVVKNDNFIFIGDSRTVAYKKIVDIEKYNFVTFISEISQGFNWLESTALNTLEKRFNETNLLYNVVINLGVNDLYNAEKYIELFNKIATENPEHKFYIVSVNPVDEEKCIENGYTDTKNKDIIDFNSKIKENLNGNITYIDSYSYLNEIGYYTSDGLHYNDETSLKVLEYISNYVKSV